MSQSIPCSDIYKKQHQCGESEQQFAQTKCSTPTFVCDTDFCSCMVLPGSFMGLGVGCDSNRWTAACSAVTVAQFSGLLCTMSVQPWANFIIIWKNHSLHLPPKFLNANCAFTWLKNTSSTTQHAWAAPTSLPPHSQTEKLTTPQLLEETPNAIWTSARNLYVWLHSTWVPAKQKTH